jgi:hypothetical protein
MEENPTKLICCRNMVLLTVIVALMEELRDDMASVNGRRNVIHGTMKHDENRMFIVVTPEQ